tara:strand:+ start:2257 stop:2940 length:684 start_codon:yes stop_codon:yes gene_type:complete
MTTRVLDFYFDYLSPYAYFSWKQIEPFCNQHHIELRAHPVVFGKLLDHWGQLGPAEISPKKIALYKFCYRYAKVHGFEFNPPRYHPFNPLPSLRLTLPEVCGPQQSRLISTLFSAGWSQGADLGSITELGEILNTAGFEQESLLNAIDQPEVKALLQQSTERAVAQGVFGVPTFIIDGELFWGNDQFEHLQLFVTGQDPLDPKQIEEMLSRDRGIDRKTLGRTGLAP